MVRRGMVRSRTEAQHLIASGRVILTTRPRAKPSTRVEPSEVITVASGARFVSRGGEKLAAALDQFQVDTEGVRALDVGAATGGFTDCLLSRGAREVVALDVGTGQFDPALAAHAGVTVLEQTDIREVDLEAVGGPFVLVVVDLSFISICTVAEDLARVTRLDGDLIVLVKPQFEVGRAGIGRGVVWDPERRRRAVTKTMVCLGGTGLDTVGEMASPLLGEHGNQEFFLWAQKRR